MKAYSIIRISVIVVSLLLISVESAFASDLFYTKVNYAAGNRPPLCFLD